MLKVEEILINKDILKIESFEETSIGFEISIIYKSWIDENIGGHIILKNGKLSLDTGEEIEYYKGNIKVKDIKSFSEAWRDKINWEKI